MAVRDEFCHMIPRIKHFDGFFYGGGDIPDVDTQLEIGLYSPCYSHVWFSRYDSFIKADKLFKTFGLKIARLTKCFK